MMPATQMRALMASVWLLGCSPAPTGTKARPVAPATKPSPPATSSRGTPAREPLPTFALARAGSAKIQATSFHAVAMAPDGAQFVSTGYSRVVVWSSETGQPLFEMAGADEDSFDAVAYSKDGTRIFVLSNKDVVAFDVATRKVADRHRIPSSYLTQLAVSPHDGTVAVGRCAKYGTGSIVTLSPSLAPIAELEVNKRQKCPEHIDFSRDGRFIATGSDSEAIVWSLKTEAQTKTIDFDDVALKSVVFRPDGQALFAGGYNAAISLVPIGGSRVLRSFGFFDHHVADMAVTPNGRHLVVATKNVLVFDVKTSRVVGRGEKAARDVAVAPDGKFFIAPVERPAMVGRFRLPDGKRLPPYDLGRHDADITSVALSPDGRHLASSDDGGTVRFWDATDGEPERSWQNPSDIYGIGARVHAAGEQLVVATDDCRLRTFDWAGKPLRMIVDENQKRDDCGSVLGVAHDGTRILTLEREVFRVWNTAGRSVVRRARFKVEDVKGALLDGDRVLLAAGQEILGVDLDGKRRTQKRLGRDFRDSILAIARAPNGKRVAVLMAHQVHILDAQTFEVLRSLQLREHVTYWGHVAFSNSGESLLVAHGSHVMIFRTDGWGLQRELNVKEEFSSRVNPILRAAALSDEGRAAVGMRRSTLLTSTTEAP